MRRPTHRLPALSSGALFTPAEMRQLRDEASAAAQAVRERSQGQVSHVGFVVRRAAGPSGDGAAVVLHHTGEVRPFQSEAEMWHWFHDVTRYPRGYDFAALFDATGPNWPGPLAEDAPGLS